MQAWEIGTVNFAKFMWHHMEISFYLFSYSTWTICFSFVELVADLCEKSFWKLSGVLIPFQNLINSKTKVQVCVIHLSFLAICDVNFYLKKHIFTKFRYSKIHLEKACVNFSKISLSKVKGSFHFHSKKVLFCLYFFLMKILIWWKVIGLQPQFWSNIRKRFLKKI